MSDTAGLNCSTGWGISVTGHITGGECCLHCSCVSFYENEEKITHQHRKVNTIIYLVIMDVYNLVTYYP